MGDRAMTLRMGDAPVGADHPPVFLAEIGTLFNQDIELARSLVGRIRTARAAVVHTPILLKGEILHTADICLDDDAIENYYSRSGQHRAERYREVIERKVVGLDQYRAIFGLCPDLPFVLSVYDIEGADFAVEIGAVALKVASSNITHVPLIRHVAGTGLPVLIDTGRSAIDEIERAVTTARDAGCSQLILEHSPDGHPALPANHNLRMLQTLATKFDVPVGLSDHHAGEEMLYLSVALGASLVEKGVTLDPDALDQDVSHAMPLQDLERVANTLHDCWLAMGEEFRDPTTPIEKIGSSARMGLVAKCDLRPGDPIDLDHVTFAFPKKGVGAEEWDEAARREIARDMSRGSVIEWGDLRPRE